MTDEQKRRISKLVSGKGFSFWQWPDLIRAQEMRLKVEAQDHTALRDSYRDLLNRSQALNELLLQHQQTARTAREELADATESSAELNSKLAKSEIDVEQLTIKLQAITTQSLHSQLESSTLKAKLSMTESHLERAELELKTEKSDHDQTRIRLVKLIEWVHRTHRLSSPPEGVRAILSRTARVTVLLLFLWPMLVVAQFPPPVLRNAWSTNVAGTPVQGVNNLSVTNLGSGTNWWFHSVRPETIARLIDVTNIIGGFGGDAGGTNARQFGTLSLTNLSGNPNVVTNIVGAGSVTVTSNNMGTFTITGTGSGGETNVIDIITNSFISANDVPYKNRYSVLVTNQVPWRLGGFGDSIGDDLPTIWITDIGRGLKYNGGYLTVISNSLGWPLTFTHSGDVTVASLTTNWWAAHFVMEDIADVTFDQAGRFLFSDTMRVAMVHSTNGGTFRVELATNGGAFVDVTGTLNALTASPTGVVYSINTNLGEWKMKVVNITGTNVVVGGGMWASNRGGISPSLLWHTGSTMSNITAVPTNVSVPILHSLQMTEVQWHAADTAVDITNSLATFISILKSSCSNSDITFIGMNHTTDLTPEYSEGNRYLQNTVITNGYFFVDTESLLGTTNELVRRNWVFSGDCIHLNPLGDWYLSEQIWRDGGIGVAYNQIVSSYLGNRVPLRISPAASQLSNMVEVVNFGQTNMFVIDLVGRVGIGRRVPSGTVKLEAEGDINLGITNLTSTIGFTRLNSGAGLTNWILFDNQNQNTASLVYNRDANTLTMVGANSLHNIIDSDNNQTVTYWSININAQPITATASAEIFRVQENGRVGINTNNPQARLHIQGANAGELILQVGISNNASYLTLDTNGLLTTHSLAITNLGTNAIMRLGAGGIVTTSIIGANLSLADDGTLSASGGGGGLFNVSQFSASSTHTNIKTTPLITNIFNHGTLVVTNDGLTSAGIEVDNGTAGQRWLIDSVVGALNYFGSSGYIGLNGAPFINLLTDHAEVITNFNVLGTNLANWLQLGGGVPAGRILRTDANTNVVAATIGTGLAFDGTTLTATASGGGATIQTNTVFVSTTAATNLNFISGTYLSFKATNASGDVSIQHDLTDANLTNWAKIDTNTFASVGVYRTIYFDAGAMVPNETLGAQFDTAQFATPTNRMLDSYIFSEAVSNIVQFKVALPMEWDVGEVKWKFFYYSTNAGATVTNVWEINSRAISNDDTLDGDWGTAVTVTNKITAANDLLRTLSTPAMIIGGTPAAEDLIWFRVRRLPAHASDNDNGEIKLLGAWLQYKESTTEPALW